LPLFFFFSRRILAPIPFCFGPSFPVLSHLGDFSGPPPPAGTHPLLRIVTLWDPPTGLCSMPPYRSVYLVFVPRRRLNSLLETTRPPPEASPFPPVPRFDLIFFPNFGGLYRRPPGTPMCGLFLNRRSPFYTALQATPPGRIFFFFFFPTTIDYAPFNLLSM